jgi:hypothetical protein
VIFDMMYLAILAVTLLFGAEGILAQGSTCEDFDDWNGNPETQWMAEDFPNPMLDVRKCGRCGVKSHICDPNKIISTANANLLDQQIMALKNSTRCACSKLTCLDKKDGFTMSIALFEKMRPIKNSKDGADRSGAPHRLNNMNLFAYTVLKHWQMGDCDDDILISYSLRDNVLYTIAGQTAGDKMESDIIGEISMAHRMQFSPSNRQEIYEGLRDMIISYREVLNGDYKGRMKYEKAQVAALRSGAPSVSAGVLIVLLTSLLLHKL